MLGLDTGCEWQLLRCSFHGLLVVTGGFYIPTSHWFNQSALSTCNHTLCQASVEVQLMFIEITFNTCKLTYDLFEASRILYITDYFDCVRRNRRLCWDIMSRCHGQTPSDIVTRIRTRSCTVCTHISRLQQETASNQQHSWTRHDLWCRMGGVWMLLTIWLSALLCFQAANPSYLYGYSLHWYTAAPTWVAHTAFCGCHGECFGEDINLAFIEEMRLSNLW